MCVSQARRGDVQYGNVNYNIYMPGYMRMLVFVTNCYNCLHFNLFYVNFTHGSRRIVLLFSHVRNLDVNIEFRKQKKI